MERWLFQFDPLPDLITNVGLLGDDVADIYSRSKQPLALFNRVRSCDYAQIRPIVAGEAD